MAAQVSEDGRIRELAEQIRARCAHAQQVRQSGTAVTSQQVEETRRKLNMALVYLHEEVRDVTVSGVQQRLQYSAQKMSLSFDLQRGASQTISCFLSCEAFFVEVVMEESSGQIRMVRLGQGTRQEDSSTLAELLSTYQYSLFDKHLKTLGDMYGQAQLKHKENLLNVITATEQVILSLYNCSPSHATMYDRIMMNSLGIVKLRNAGLPLKIIFFVQRHDLASNPQLFTNDYSVHQCPDSVGVSADVLVERSAQLYRLSVDPNLFDSTKGQYRPPQGTVAVPLTLVLVLSIKLPLCGKVMTKLHQAVYGDDKNIPNFVGPHIDQLLLTESGQEKAENHVVYLPGQVHRYSLIIPSNAPPYCRGVLLPHSKVPFLHPAHVPTIITLLRQQLTYNVMLESCFSRSTVQWPLSACDETFEEHHWKVTTCPPQWIMATTLLQSSPTSFTSLSIRFVIGEDSSFPVMVQVSLGGGDTRTVSMLSQVANRCMSIPVTLRIVWTYPNMLGHPISTAIGKHYSLLVQFKEELSQCPPKKEWFATTVIGMAHSSLKRQWDN